jgi:tRNA-2-methylthio-N6-dimethylallyladenosine synthase
MIRRLAPNAAISTDIIVGFPGESEEDFMESMDVLKSVKFEQLFSFKYSSRPHTAATKFDNQIENDISGERLTRLQTKHTEILDEVMDAQLGAIHEVYFDELKSEGRVSGRSDDGKLVFVKGSEELLGRIVPVKIEKVSRSLLEGVVI